MKASPYRSYLLGVLTVIVAFNYLDRVALGILLQDIKADLSLSDTELGFLSGIAFALFYSIMGIPIARLADRGHRVLIIALTSALWSVAVALCGAAQSFAQLLLIRVAVAVGEAGCVPPALSLIADYFSRAERPRAAAIYGLGSALSGVLGYFLAGWLNEIYGWRMTFVLLGLPGVVLAALAWITLAEPRSLRKPEDAAVAATRRSPNAPQPSMREVAAVLWNNTTFRQLLLCLSLNLFFSYGVGQWLPTFFIRSYGMTTGEIGTWLALICGLAGVGGNYLCGEWASRRAANNETLQLRVIAVAICVAGLFAILAYSFANLYLALALIGMFVIGLATLNAPLISTIQTLVPARMRAVSFAYVYLIGNLIGMGLGPLAVGAISDFLQPRLAEESLRYALLILSPGYFWCAWHAWRASKTVARDIAAANAAHEAGNEEAMTSAAPVPGGRAASSAVR